jgi:hypothetical protein
MAHPFVLGLALAGAAPDAAAPPMFDGEASPLQLFRSVCMEGTATLKKGSAELIGYANLPHSAKVALDSSFSPDPPRAQKARNAVYRIGGEDLFLMLPVAADLPQTKFAADYASSCAVIWRGRDFLKARRAIVPDSAVRFPDADPSKAPPGFAFYGTHGPDVRMTVAASFGWTALRSAPRAPSLEGDK